MLRPTFLTPGIAWKRCLDGAVEGLKLCGGVTGGLRVDVDDVAVGGVELEVDVLELVEAADEHSCAYEQNERERGLKDDESALQQGGAGCGGAGAGAESIGWVCVGGDPCGGYAEEDAGEKRECEGKGEHHAGGASFDGDVLCAGEGHGEEHAGSGVGDDEACGTADDGEDDALGEELADDSCAHRA